MRVRSVAVVANPDKIKAREEEPRLKSWLKERRLTALSRNQIEKADAVVTLGGDGTILAIAPRAALAGVPVLGVNIGRMGFLTAVELSQMYPFLERWLGGQLRLSERMMLDVSAPRVKHQLLALNDAVIRIGSTARVTTIYASIERENLGCFVGDGVIVATPTGSTAYSLSAQGPVVHPEVEALVLTPICAHSFTQRPVVFPGRHTLELRVHDASHRHDVQLCLDGQRVFPLKSDDRIYVRRSPHKLKLVRDPEVSFFEVLREKLSW
ncbi:MAG: NAD(+)/NADH kinase, partial [Elusimicrobia bacterium]|nr:NAD(+)/NADH kinase [Candidatus Obscuribacterium magneticum]